MFSGKLKKLGETLKTEKIKPIYLNRKSSISYYKNGQRNGAYEEMTDEGFVYVKGNYKNGLMDGEWVYFFENKQKKAIGSFLSGDGENIGGSGIPKNGRDGEWVLYYENGNKEQIGSFVHGKVEGEFKFYHDNGQLSREGKYVNGEREGEWKFYRDNGQLKQEEQYVNGKLHGEFKLYHDNGQLGEEGQYVNGVGEGKRKFYYENGQLKQMDIMESGKLNGLLVLFHENGKIAKKGTKLNGKDNGLIKSFFENGNPELEAFFVKGTAHGPVKSYYSNGKLKMKAKVDSTSLADGGIYGDSYIYNEDGALSAHIFVNKDGTIVDKMKKNNTYTSTGKKTSHNCAWCGRNFKGLGWGITSLSGTRNKNQCSAGENFVDWDETGFSAFSNFWLCSKKCAIEKCWAE
jgi:antitoxin component YwqK of YwqJK toxin-antitoxin module